MRGKSGGVLNIYSIQHVVFGKFCVAGYVFSYKLDKS